MEKQKRRQIKKETNNIKDTKKKTQIKTQIKNIRYDLFLLFYQSVLYSVI